MYSNNKGFILGYSKNAERSAVGFRTAQKKASNSKSKSLISFDCSSHILTVAPTGSGKGVNSIIPNLLHYQGPVISLDPKGEQVGIVKRAREAMGHRVVVLDPFGITEFESDSFNVLDITGLENFSADDDSFSLAHELIGTNLADPFWDNHAKILISGLINYFWKCKPASEHTFGNIRSMINDELAYELAVILDTRMNEISRATADSFKGYLTLPSDKTRPSVDGTAVQAFSSLFSDRIDAFLSKSTFDLKDIVDGKPTDIFVVFPPDKLRSHNRLLKLIFSVFFKAIVSRRKLPEQKTLVILDECATLGKFEFLESMISLSRGYGVAIQTIWQDISQMKKEYKEGYSSIINNSGAWQFFGDLKPNLVKELAELTGVDAEVLKNLSKDDQILMIERKTYAPAQKVNYLKDRLFAGQFDPNPFLGI